MNYRKSYYLLVASVVVCMAIMGLGMTSDADWLMAVGIVVMLAGVGQGIAFIRCPHCGHSLEVRHGLTKYCPHCGNKLE